jgi:preprotein translocase subunit SecY
VAIYGVAFFLTTLGIIYVQEAERRIPVNYSSRCCAAIVWGCCCIC